MQNTAIAEKPANTEQEYRDIMVITGSPVIKTGNVSFMFMIHADPERKIWKMPQKFGWFWKEEDDTLCFSVFDGARGLVVGSGFDHHDTEEFEKEKLNAIPSCTLLIDDVLFRRFKALMDKHGVPFRYFRSHKPLMTS